MPREIEMFNNIRVIYTVSSASVITSFEPKSEFINICKRPTNIRTQSETKVNSIFSELFGEVDVMIFSWCYKSINICSKCISC